MRDAFRSLLADGLEAAQRDVQASEAVARTIRNFQTALVPGLLQTADYARRVLTLADVMEAGGIDAAVAVRLERQQILHQEGRRFEFLMTEGALRWRPGPVEVVTAQLQQVGSIATLENVDIGVIPADAEMRAIPRCPFIISEDRDGGLPPTVFVELPHRAVDVTEPADVEIYRTQLALLRRSALYGADAGAFIRSIAG